VSILPGPASTHNQLVTAKAAYDFVQDSVASMIHDSIANIDFTTVSLQDSIDIHTDTLQSHNARLKVMELIDHTHSNKATLDATTASFTTAINTTISSHTDSISKHTDTLQVHNTRLQVLEDSTHTHSNKTILDATTASFTTAKDTRLSGVNDTILVMVRVTDDTLTSSEVKSGYIFPINRTLNGCNLVLVEAFMVATVETYLICQCPMAQGRVFL
jgi:DNA phosphorothioation-dependent restriction protein DptG